MFKNLEEIGEGDKAQFGTKAFYLGALMQEGLRVPAGFAVHRDFAGAIDDELFESWAVRSSASDEDQLEESKAGQYKSYLNVTDVQSVLRQCFAENAITSAIAQEMIYSDFGGVCFSRSLEGSVEIEVCLGHNAGVTQGRDQIARVTMAGDSVSYSDDRHGLLHQVCMEQLSKLASHVRALEQSWGFPVDVEWCVKDGELFFLQARPITGLSTSVRIEHIKEQTLQALQDEVRTRGWGLWTDFSIGDMFRNPSRLFLDLVNDDRGPQWSMRRVFQDLGLSPSSKLNGPIFVAICGRAFIHVGNYFDFLFPGCAFGTAKRGLVRRAHAGMKSWARTMAHVGRLACVVPFRFRVLRRRFSTDYNNAKLSALFLEAHGCAQRDYKCMALHELFEHFDRIQLAMGDAIYAHVMSDVIAGLSHAIANACLRVRFGKGARDREFSLTTGLEGNFNTETTLALYDVASGRLSLEAFLEAFGHRGNPDWDVASRRWREDPEKVQRMADALRKSGINQRENFEKQMATRKEAERKLARHPFIMRQVRYLQIYSPLREQTQSVVYAFVEALLNVILAIGEKAELGDDVFALRMDEFTKLRSAGIAPGKPQLAERRRDTVLSQRIHLPHVFDSSDLSPDLFNPKELEKNEGLLKGTVVSAGVVVGRARVIHDLSEAGELSSSDIVVTQFADPSYASILLSAGGLILEQGSIYSHTAILAREFGMPAVVNVYQATRIIKDGQELRFDASEGKIWLGEMPAIPLL
jgi:pyruvate,water dikinase